MLVHNGFVNVGLIFPFSCEVVGVLPRLEWPDNLRIGESVLADIGVNCFPINRNWPKPHRKLCHHPFRHLSKLVNLYKQRGRRQFFQDAGVLMKGGYGRQRSGNGETGGELVHKRFQRTGSCRKPLNNTPERHCKASGETARLRVGKRCRSVLKAISPSRRARGAPRQ